VQQPTPVAYGRNVGRRTVQCGRIAVKSKSNRSCDHHRLRGSLAPVPTKRHSLDLSALRSLDFWGSQEFRLRRSEGYPKHGHGLGPSTGSVISKQVSKNIYKRCIKIKLSQMCRGLIKQKQEAQLMLTTGAMRLAVSRGQQTCYHFGSVATFR